MKIERLPNNINIYAFPKWEDLEKQYITFCHLAKQQSWRTTVKQLQLSGGIFSWGKSKRRIFTNYLLQD